MHFCMRIACAVQSQRHRKRAHFGCMALPLADVSVPALMHFLPFNPNPLIALPYRIARQVNSILAPKLQVSKLPCTPCRFTHNLLTMPTRTPHVCVLALSPVIQIALQSSHVNGGHRQKCVPVSSLHKIWTCKVFNFATAPPGRSSAP